MDDETQPLLTNKRATRESAMSYEVVDSGEQVHVQTRSGKRCCFICGIVFLVLLFVAAIIVLVVLLLLIGYSPPVVLTTCGKVQGTVQDQVSVFKGIPYAVPPINDKRWKPPQKMSNSTKTCWSGIFIANKFPSPCAQLKEGRGEPLGSEDCLYLNIYTPTTEVTANLPVLFYIHGGYLQFLNAQVPGYSPNELITKKLNVVFVSVQYRLNAFGFLTLDVLGNNSGNYGFQDQIVALQWVKQNIQNFGGNPDQVTIFGQSSGATSVWALMASPLAKGLFHRAWMMSGSPVFDKPIKEAAEANRFFLTKTGCKTAEDLRKLSTIKVLKALLPEWDFAESTDLPIKGRLEMALAVVDGTIIPKPPMEALMTGEGNDVPLLIGTTAQELDLNPYPGLALKSWSWDNLRNYTASHLDTFAMNITNQSTILYPAERDPEYVFTTMGTDIRLTCGNNLMAEKASKGMKSGLYRYIVTAFPSKPVIVFDLPFPCKYAFHTLDAIAFFGSLGEVIPTPSAADTAFVENLQQNVMNFVRTGKPLDPKWQAYPNHTALLSASITYVPIYHQEKCQFWINNNFSQYGWIN